MKKNLLKKLTAFIIALLMISGNIYAQSWNANGSNIFNTNRGNVGIDTTAPNGKLHINTRTPAALALNITGTDAYVSMNSTLLQTTNSGRDLNIRAYSPPAVNLPPPAVNLSPGNILLQAPASGFLIKLGNVGIGTTTPIHKLHVAGASVLANSTRILSNAAPNSVIAGAIQDDGASVISGIGGKGATAGSAWSVGTTGTALNFNFSNGSTDHSMQTAIQIMANRNLSLIPGRSGKVGIGTTTPGFLLDVAGRMRMRSDNNTAGTWFMNAANTADVAFVGMANDNYVGMYGSGPAGWGFLMNTLTGNVGIGTASPAYKLDVCGTIRAKECRINTGWCDYVFADDYKLPSLSSVEAFIKKNKHLPDVTPGPEIENNGLEVGKVSSQMIKKIEELTLYVIELQKQVDALKNNHHKN